MTTPRKIIQIAAGAATARTPPGPAIPEAFLFALADDGILWQWNFHPSNPKQPDWIQLPPLPRP
jgi:hypothetical protein